MIIFSYSASAPPRHRLGTASACTYTIMSLLSAICLSAWRFPLNLRASPHRLHATQRILQRLTTALTPPLHHLGAASAPATQLLKEINYFLLQNLSTASAPPRHRLGTASAPPRHQPANYLKKLIIFSYSASAPPRHRLGTASAPPRHRLGTASAPPRQRLEIGRAHV